MVYRHRLEAFGVGQRGDERAFRRETVCRAPGALPFAAVGTDKAMVGGAVAEACEGDEVAGGVDGLHRLGRHARAVGHDEARRHAPPAEEGCAGCHIAGGDSRGGIAGGLLPGVVDVHIVDEAVMIAIILAFPAERDMLCCGGHSRKDDTVVLPRGGYRGNDR